MNENILIILVLLFGGFAIRFALTLTGQNWAKTYQQTVAFLVLPFVTFVITKTISGNISLSLGMIGAMVLFILMILCTLYLSKVPKEVWSAIWGLPFFVLKQVTALFKIGNPNKNFKHSEHTRKVSIDDVLKKDK